jgi:2-hydroxymuconate-semialdehyde hydrolase
MHGLLRALGLSSASIYGGSMGAGTALALALEHPEAIERLILRSPPPFDGTIGDVLKPFAQLGVLYRLVGARMAARIVMALPQWRAAQRREPRFDYRRFIGSQRAAAIPAAVAALRDGEGLPAERFGEIMQPTLVLAHPDDALHPLASAELLRERMPHARLAIAPHARYWADNPAYLAEIVASFVKGELTTTGGERTIVHRHAGAEGAR